LAIAVLLGWSLVVPLAFRVLGRRNGTLFAVIGGYLWLPPVVASLPLGFASLRFDKQAAIGLALLIAIVVWDRRAFWAFRPKPLDAPMLIFAASMALVVTAGQYVTWDVADGIAWGRLWWLVPYIAARLYFGEGDGARRIGVGVVLGGLTYIPVVAYESLMGPSWYLRNRIYGLSVLEGMANRLGGWRPEGFLNHGIELSCWMALSAVIALWLWLGREWRPRWGPAWGPSLLLVLGTIATRGVYGYINLAVGALAVAVTTSLRTRAALIALALLVPLYCGLRISGVWDAKVLVDLAGRTGRASTVQVRIDCEDRMVTAVLDRNPAFGFGRPLGMAWTGEPNTVAPAADGGWLVYLWVGGIIGLSLQLAALLLMPVGLALMDPPGGWQPEESVPPAWGLALFLILNALDGLHNNASFTPAALAVGSIVGLGLRGSRARDRGATRPATRGADRLVSRHGGRRPLPTAVAVALILIVLELPEIVAALTGSQLGPPPIPAGAPAPVLPSRTGNTECCIETMSFAESRPSVQLQGETSHGEREPSDNEAD
jgi:hypothetical protein